MGRAGCSDTPGAKICLCLLMLFHEYEIYSKYEEYYCCKVVPLKGFSFEKY